MKKRVRIEFICPKCGGGTYGTSNASHWEIAIGHCYGGPNEDNGCKFSWPRAEDWRYYAKVTVEHYESKQEFDSIEEPN